MDDPLRSTVPLVAPAADPTAAPALGGLLAPLAPTGGAPADAGLLAFAWRTPAPDGRHRVQVARDAAFAALVADVVVPGDVLTLHDVLDEDDRTYYWRVGDGQAWSAPAAFRAASDDAAIAFRDAQIMAARVHEAAQAAVRAASEAADAEANAPWRTGTTSRSEVLLLLYVLFVTFALTVVLVFRAGP